MLTTVPNVPATYDEVLLDTEETLWADGWPESAERLAIMNRTEVQAMLTATEELGSEYDSTARALRALLATEFPEGLTD